MMDWLFGKKCHYCERRDHLYSIKRMIVNGRDVLVYPACYQCRRQARVAMDFALGEVDHHVVYSSTVDGFKIEPVPPEVTPSPQGPVRIYPWEEICICNGQPPGCPVCF